MWKDYSRLHNGALPGFGLFFSPPPFPFAHCLFLKPWYQVDDYSQTNVPSIWAIGDVTDRIQLTPVALMEGMKMVAKCFGPADLAEDAIKPDYEGIATAVFSQPPIVRPLSM